jgi:hypothetical protein
MYALWFRCAGGRGGRRFRDGRGSSDGGSGCGIQGWVVDVFAVGGDEVSGEFGECGTELGDEVFSD